MRCVQPGSFDMASESGERTRPRVLIAAPRRNVLEREKFAMARASSPAREARGRSPERMVLERDPYYSDRNNAKHRLGKVRVSDFCIPC